MCTTIEQQRPKNILQLSKDEKRKFINSFDYILADCDGVIWQLLNPIDGVGKAIVTLKENGKQFYYCTNNSTPSKDCYNKKLKAAETNSNYEDVIHPAVAAVIYLKKINFKGLIYVLASTNFVQVIRNAGFNVIDGPYEACEEIASTFLKRLYDKEPVKAVIIDTDFNMTYSKLVRAEYYLKDPECIFISGATDVVVGITNTTHLIGPGVFADILEKSSGKKPIIVGKPGNGLREAIIEKFKFPDNKRVLFVGDMLTQDIGFGKFCGFQTLLVFSGATSEDVMLKHNIPNEIPNFCATDLSDFTKIYNEINDK